MNAIPSVCPTCRRPVPFKAVLWKNGNTPYCPHKGCRVAMVPNQKPVKANKADWPDWQESR